MTETPAMAGIPSGGRGRGLRLRQAVLLGVCAVLLAYFAVFFRESRWQPSVDLAWVLAVLGWIAAFWSRQKSRAPRVPHPYVFYALYVLVLLPFATNWRWAMTGDSLGWVFSGMDLAERGPVKSLLSVRGMPEYGVGHFSYAQQALHNVFMVLISPTLFWHRFGQIMVGLVSLIAMVAAYGRLVAPQFGLLVGACTLSTSIIIVHTFSSYPLLDALATGSAVLAAALWVRDDPDARRAWLLLGACTGLALHLTPSGWAMGVFVSLWLGPLALTRRWPPLNLVAGIGCAVIVALPVLLQFALGQGNLMFSQIERPGYTVEKLARLFWEAVTIPFRSDIQVAGAFGPQLPPGFRWLFVPGLLLTPLFARTFPGGRLIAACFLVHAALLAGMQGQYDHLSVKRALVLVPLATCLVFLPFHRYLRRLPVVLVVVAIWAGFGVRNLLDDVGPGRIGYTLLDGVVEAHQRFSDAPVCVYMTDDLRWYQFMPGSKLDRLYGLAPHVARVTDVHDPRCATYLCYCPQREMLDLAGLGYTPIPMLGSSELRCGRKPPVAPGA